MGQRRGLRNEPSPWRGAGRVARTARFLLYCLILWAPLPLGSNRPVFWAINGFVATLILLLFGLGEVFATHRRTFDWRPAAWLAVAMALWAGWMVAQAVPGVPASLRHPIWSELAAHLPGPIAGTISGSPSATWTTICQAVPTAFLAFVAMRLAFHRERGIFLLNLLVATTTAVAGYGLAAQYFGFRQVFLLDSVAYPGFVTATFVGRNAAAAYFVIGLAAASALLAGRLQAKLGRAGAAKSWFMSAAEMVGGGGIYLVACLILATAILNSGSRGGTTAGGIALMSVAYLTVRGGATEKRAVGGMFVVIGAALFAVVAISGDLLFHRLASGVDTEDRLLVYRDTIDMILARPFLGHGAGGFADIYPLFHRLAPGPAVWDHAHDTYLQMAAELGLPISVLLIVAVAGVLVVIFREIRGDAPAPAAIAAVGAAVALAVHVLVDFSVQIQAVGLTLAVLVGAGLGEALRLSRQRSEAPAERPGAAEPSPSPAPRERVYVTIPTTAKG